MGLSGLRPSALTWPFPCLVRLGWATARSANPEPARARGRAYLLRGNGAVFSRGFGRVCGRLRRAGVWAEDLRCVGDRWLRRHLAAEHRAGRLRGPVVLVGHSCGGRYALHAAGRLEPLGVAIDLLLCVDVAWPFDVPGNVRRAVHLYRGGPRLYPARPLRPAPGSGAEVENIDLNAPGSPVRARRLHHLNVTANADVQGWIVTRILETVTGVESSDGAVGR